MLDWLTTTQLVVAIAAGSFCVLSGLAGRPPADLTLGVTLLVEMLLVVQFVVALASPAFGNSPTGSVLEFYVYLVTAMLLPPLAVLWGLVERRSKWSTVVLGVVCLAIAVMVWRMHQIWFVQVA